MRLLLKSTSQGLLWKSTKVWLCCTTELSDIDELKWISWNWSFNTPCKSLKGILVLFEEAKPYERDTSKFYNPKIQKVSVVIDGKPDQLYTQEMRLFEQYDETHKYFTEGKQANEVMRSKNNCNYMI